MTITYEKAKELKDAGFPQSFNTIPAISPVTSPSRYERIDGEIVLIPTLSELIEKCWNVDHYFKLEYYPYNDVHTQFVAQDQEKEGSSNRKGHGNSPEEAVANLWLAINRK